MDKKEANKFLREWVCRLGLKDWNIKLKINVKPDEMFLHDTVGCVRYETDLKQAIIQILDEKEFSNKDFSFDFEKTIIHELSQLVFSVIDDDENSLQSKIIHQKIDDMARAFVLTKRNCVDREHYGL